MYRNEKRMLLSLCDTMQEAHQEIFNSESTNEVKDLCSSCQEAAIRIGESLENEGEGLYSEEVNRLEQYCEAVYSLSERNDINEDDIFGLDKIVENVIDSIICIHTRLKVAFFPYKADMWDSLESFYLAAKEDPETEAYLVPIPYFGPLNISVIFCLIGWNLYGCSVWCYINSFISFFYQPMNSPNNSFDIYNNR